MAKLRIGIIGAGPSGTTAAKACLEEGLDVVVYEKSDCTGGLWRYRDEDIEGIASVMKSTIINTSKEVSAFSDFPPPPEYPNYMHNTTMVKYFDLYGEKFGFEKYVKLRHDIINLEPNTDYEETGKWKITAKDLNTGQLISDVFDGVMICTGHHITPLIPTFKDQNKFKGKIIHTHSYKKPNGFEDKNVIVVGIGNSGGDVVVELSTVAKKVYLSTRRGAWVMNRVGPNGKPADDLFQRRFLLTIMQCLPYDWVCSYFEWFTNSRFNHNDYQLKPKHRILEQHVTINDALPNKILSGTVVVKGDIDRFTENGIIFEGEENETICDTVVLATGYKISFPFISQSLIPTDKNQVNLYKYAFATNLKHPKTLAFISLIQPLGAIVPIGELQSRWFALLMANKLRLPSVETMNEDIHKKKQLLKQRFYQSSRHTIEVEWIPFMDELATIVGVKPNLFKYFLTDPELWRALYFGSCVPYQYRLEGPHPWSGARNAILTVQDRIEAPLRTRISSDKKSADSKNLNLSKIFFGLIIIVFFAYLVNIFFRT